MLDDLFEGEEDDEEAEELMESVFAEIGLDLQGQMKSVPKAQLPAGQVKSTELLPDTEDAELNKLIAQLM